MQDIVNQVKRVSDLIAEISLAARPAEVVAVFKLAADPVALLTGAAARAGRCASSA